MFISEPSSSQKTTSGAISREFRSFSKGPLIATFTGILVLFVGLGMLGSYFEKEIVVLTQKVADLFGIWGLCLITLFGDSFFTPFPPDLSLVVISKSALRGEWPLYVSLIAFTSFCAGHIAYGFGRILIQVEGLPKALRNLPEKNAETVKKFGVWGVILGAITPLPFSFTCMSAGFLRMNYGHFVLASFSRVPRIYAYYFIISSSDVFKLLF